MMIILALSLLLTSHVYGLALDKQPNIIFMFGDDLGNGDVGWHHDDVHTPILNDLVANGIELDSNYVQVACTPSRAALMTGYYPYHIGFSHGVAKPCQQECLPFEKQTMPEALKEIGYDTHMVGKWHLGYCDYACCPFNRGFDTFIGLYQGFHDHWQHNNWYDVMDGHDLNNGTEPLYMDGTHSVDICRDRTVEIINNHDDTDTPFFIYLSWTTPHSPFEAKTEYYDMYPDETNEDRRHYLGMITQMDAAIGDVVTALEDTGYMDNTIIIFMADNGGESPIGRNDPYRSAKGTLYEGGVRSAAMAYSPLFTQSGYKADGLIHITDWWPTFVTLGGGTPASGIDGIDQSEFLINGADSARTEFVVNIDQVYPEEYGLRALRSGDYKLIHGYTGQCDGWWPNTETYYSDHCRWDMTGGTYWGSKKRSLTKRGGYQLTAAQLTAQSNCVDDSADDVRLYNIVDDPSETTNLADDFPDLVDEMMAKLDDYAASYVYTPAYADEYNYDADPANWDDVWAPGWCDYSNAVYDWP